MFRPGTSGSLGVAVGPLHFRREWNGPVSAAFPGSAWRVVRDLAPGFGVVRPHGRRFLTGGRAARPP
ncbi:hypothetical protein C1701_00940 [Actinoalloteichus sp. AHMU CJ021]|nr:hypothetical protein C1701_00940 [Actinoalloteichus sp. AHMU CJ021]